MFPCMQMEEYIEYEPSDIFQVKLVVKNLVLGYPGTHSMRMKATTVFIRWMNFSSLNKIYKL